MKKRISVFILFFAMISVISCVAPQPRMPIRIVDYESQLGGDKVSGNITYNGKTVKGVKTEEPHGTTAVIYKNEDNVYKTVYSNENFVDYAHLKENYIDITIKRRFYRFSTEMACLKACLIASIVGIGGGIALEPEEYTDNIFLTEGSAWESSFSKDFRQGKPIEMILYVTNTGTMKLKDEFIVVDVLPDFLEFQKAGWTTDAMGSVVEDVTYDIHVKGNKQILAFKIKPRDAGIGSFETVMIKITTTPNMDKLKSRPYIMTEKRKQEKLKEQKEKEKTKIIIVK